MEYDQYLVNLVFEYLPLYFTEEQIELILTQKNPTGPDGIRSQLAELDIQFFGRAYFPSYFEKAIPDFHKEQYKLMEDIESQGGGSKIAIAAPRGGAKTTLWDFIFPLHNALYMKKHFIILISDSSTQAEGYLTNIKEEIEGNIAILEDFGKLQGSTWRMDEILLKNGVKIGAKGSGKGIRGIKHLHYRPDLFVLDDCENDTNVESEDQRKKLLSWFDKAIAKAGNETTDIIVIGTILHYDSLLSKLLERPGFKIKRYKGLIKDSKSPLWQDWKDIYVNLDNPDRVDDARYFYEQNQTEMDEGTEVIWKDKMPYYDYQVMIIDEGLASFNSEVQNEPINPEDCPIKEEEFQYYGTADNPMPDLTQCVIKGAVDPSMGKTRRSDKSAICAIARDPNGYMYVLFSDGARRHPDKIITDILGYATQFNFQEFGCEVVQFQELFAHNLRKEAAAQGIYININELRPTTDKILRISGIIPMIKNGYIKFHKSQKELINELVYLGKWKTDDEADALQMVVSLFTAIQKDFRHALLPNISGVAGKW